MVEDGVEESQVKCDTTESNHKKKKKYESEKLNKRKAYLKQLLPMFL